MRKLVFVGIGAMLMTTLALSQPTLVKDIGSAPAGIFGKGEGTVNDAFMPVGDLLYFPVTDQKGKELWRTDGTSDGTFRVIDVNKGAADSYVMGTELGISLVFVTKPSQLWTTTGTEGTTQSLGFIKIDDEIAEVTNIWTVANKVIVSALKDSKIALFEYNGSGTVTLLKEIVDDENVSLTLSTTVGTNRVFVLTRYDGFTYESEIWVTDGTSGGTKKVATYADNIEDIATLGNDVIIENTQSQVLKVSIPTGTVTQLHDFSGMYVNHLFSFTNTKALIDTQDGLWVTDGTSVGTTPLIDYLFSVREIAVANNKAYFIGYQSGVVEPRIFETDGTVSGTKEWAPVIDVVGTPYVTAPKQIAVLGDKVISIYTNPYYGMEIAAVNGITRTLVKDINPIQGGSNAQNFQLFKDKIFFVADDGTNGMEVWSTDGTEAGTQLLKNAVEGTSSGVTDKDLFLFNDEIYFSASGSSVDNVWRTTNHGSDAEEFFATYGGSVLGSANDTIYMVTKPAFLYKSDGDNEEPAFVSQFPSTSAEARYPSENFSLGDKFVFSMFSIGVGATYGQELWTLDWNTQEIHVLKDINPGLNDGLFGSTYGESKQRIFKIDETKAIFAADDGVNGVELWVTDGTESGTTLLKDINPGATSSNPRNINATLDGLVYFATDDGLWSTDGTSGETVKVTSFNTINNVVKFDNDIYVTASEGSNWFIFKKSGSKVQQLSSAPGEMIALGDQLYVAVENGLTINSTTESLAGTPSNFYVFEDQLYFAVNGQLWHSKGTEATTRMASDIEPIRFKQAGDLLFMTANSKEYGIELFKTEIQKFSQDIDFEVANKLRDDAPFQLTATASSGNPVTFELVSGNVTLSGNTVTITGSGDVSIKAITQGDDTFETTEVIETFNVAEPVGLGDDVALVKIYPNPVESNLFVTAPGHLRILDSNGREVINENVIDNVDVSALAPGLYIVVINNTHLKIVKR